MPVLMNAMSYRVYFWSNEGSPREPVHIHISEGNPHANGTKFWINSNGKLEMDHNKSQIPSGDLKRLKKLLEGYSDDFVKAWEKHFHEKARFKDQEGRGKSGRER